MNIKRLGRKSYLDTNSLQVEWLGAEDAKQEVRGSSVGGREACVFRVKNRVKSDCPVGPLPILKYFFSIFSVHFLAFHITAGFTSKLVYKNRQWCQPSITADMPMSVQNPAVKGFFKPTVMLRSRAVIFNVHETIWNSHWDWTYHRILPEGAIYDLEIVDPRNTYPFVVASIPENLVDRGPR